jgi:pimeloyl-ACP methyl ester carboxylesterase
MSSLPRPSRPRSPRGARLETSERSPQAAGWADVGQARRFAAYLRTGADPEFYIDPGNFDITKELSQLTAPVLVLHRRGLAFPTLEVSRQAAIHAPRGRFVQLEGSALMPFMGDTDSVFAAMSDFLAEPVNQINSAGLTAPVNFDGPCAG